MGLLFLKILLFTTLFIILIYALRVVCAFRSLKSISQAAESMRCLKDEFCPMFNVDFESALTGALRDFSKGETIKHTMQLYDVLNSMNNSEKAFYVIYPSSIFKTRDVKFVSDKIQDNLYDLLHFVYVVEDKYKNTVKTETGKELFLEFFDSISKDIDPTLCRKIKDYYEGK